VKNQFVVKVIPPEGLRVYRLHFGRRHIAVVAGTLATVLIAVVCAHVFQLQRAEANVRALESVTADQQRRLDALAAQAQTIGDHLREIENRDAQLRKTMGITDKPHAAAGAATLPTHASVSLPAVASELRILAKASSEAAADQSRLRASALHVLNLRHLHLMMRQELLAAIPSINPAGDVAVRSGFGWRGSPWPEFHRGLDLAAEYGDPVRAAASGVVASAGWDDGGYGIKVDIDHGNGYHTWYAHLSKTIVRTGDRVTKGQVIANVGSTGESTGAHLHYQVMHDGEPIDPTPFLSGIPKAIVATLPAASE
jgi:murein DD-endopeptidase MepM/ murein hydrolase activator NlpD